MTVKPLPGDSNGVGLDTKVTNLTNTVNNTSSTLTKASVQLALKQAQIELVYHYLNNGRLDAGNILSTMT